MTYLILGLAIFLGTHSVRIIADAWRTARIAQFGEGAWKGIYSVISIAGFVLIVVGYGEARQHAMVLWTPPAWTAHVASLLTLVAFVLVASAYVRGTRTKAAIGHPMIAGVKVWAFAHLLANGTLADLMLFGAFLVWAIADFVAARRRDRVAGTTYPSGSVARDALAIVIGVAAWALFAFYLHGLWIGVRPFA
jgi:uncharacterized membrane protein